MLYSDTIRTFSDAPLKQKDRKCTDIVCTIIAACFALTLFIAAFVMMNKDNYYKSNFPTDSDSIPCSYGKNAQYPLVYFPDINDKNTRVCVSLCPNDGDSQIFCRTNSAVGSCSKVNIYQTTQDFQRLGGFCAPVDQAAKQKLIQNIGLESKWTFLNTYDTIRLSLLISLAIGIIWMVLVQVLPRIMAVLSTFLAILILLIGSIILFIDNPKGYQGKQGTKIIVAIVLLAIAFLFVFFIMFYRRRIKMMALFIDWSTRYLPNNIVFIAWIPIFIILTLGLIVLVFFQHLAFISSSEPTKTDNDIYLKLQPSFIWELLNIIEFLWGLQFLKDSFNFIISGSAVQWYTKQQNGFFFTFGRLIKYHFGSVAGGSFLNTFFNFIDFFFQSIRCYPEGRCSKMAPICDKLFGCCGGCLCSFVRTDVYSYINLTGIPYCNACKNCQTLNHKSHQVVGSQSIQFFYRISSYITCVGLSLLICYAIQKAKISAINVESLLIIAVLSYCIVAYFIDIHADAAEGIHVSSLFERYFESDKNGIQKDEFKKQLKAMGKMYDDGTC